MLSLNRVFSWRRAWRRYEVWFIRLGLANGEGAWWFRYLLLNPGRGGCPGEPRVMPVQVWATWFPRDEHPRTFIQGFPPLTLALSARGRSPFYFRAGDNSIDENSCRGDLQAEGHAIAWGLHCRSTFGVTLSDKGWIGFSRTPHSDAVFSGWIVLDGKRFEGETLGFGLQGHNCGYRHRNQWTWAHAYFRGVDGLPTTLEALVYEMPLGLRFRKAVLWHREQQHVFRSLHETARDTNRLKWDFSCATRDGHRASASFDGSGASAHRLPYMKTDCRGSFEVRNNSLAKATLRFEDRGRQIEELVTTNGAVLEMAGE